MVKVDCRPQMKTGEAAVLERLSRMLSSGERSDIQFVVKGTAIPAHSFIIEDSSPVLTAMFQHNTEEASNRSVTVEDIEPDVFRQLLHYLYTGDADVENEELTEPLYIAADKYQIHSLKYWCSSELSETVSNENAARLLAIAHLHSDENLLEECSNFIVGNKVVFFEREDFKLLSKSYPDLFFNITKLMNS